MLSDSRYAAESHSTQASHRTKQVSAAALPADTSARCTRTHSAPCPGPSSHAGLQTSDVDSETDTSCGMLSVNKMLESKPVLSTWTTPP